MGRWSVDNQRRNDEPFGWWGFRDQPGEPLSIVDLIARGSLDARVAAFLWLAIERRASFAVTAAPAQAGKTTTLTALLAFLPPEVQPVYLRGWYERFTFFDETTPESAYLLCNEISSHLPTYLWGHGVRRLFEAMRDGYGAAMTTHAEGAAGIIRLLSAFPLEVPLPLLSELDLVLTLAVGSGPAGITRRVSRVEVLHDRAAQPRAETIAQRDVLLGPLESSPGRLIGLLSDRFGVAPELATAELARRERYLDQLRRDGVAAGPAVRDAIRQWSQQGA